MVKSETTCALIIGNRNKRIEELESVLAAYLYFSEITIIPGIENICKLSRNHHFHLIIVTDSLIERLNKDLLLTIRGLFPDAKVICLFDKLTQEIEIAMRSVGLVFLGSYNHFFKTAQHILGELLTSFYEEKNDRK